MDNLDLYTVNLFKVIDSKDGEASNSFGGQQESRWPLANTKSIRDFPNMISARVIKGKILECEHTKLMGPDVKFKTVINYQNILEAGHSLGVAMIPQDGYIAKMDN